MSEFLGNQEEREGRRATLKNMILELHRGRKPEELKEQFRELIDTVGATEIGKLETELISEGLPETEVKRLCDVHAAIFEDALQPVEKPDGDPGHPVHIFLEENKALGHVVKQIRAGLSEVASGDQANLVIRNLRNLLLQLKEVEKHYLRKEHLLFPYLEKHGIKGPPSVMWAVHDDVRAGLKQALALVESVSEDDAAGLAQQLGSSLPATLDVIEGMFVKEENILFPMAMQILGDEEWRAISKGSGEIGYTLIRPPDGVPYQEAKPTPGPAPAQPGSGAPTRQPTLEVTDALVHLNVGAISVRELDLLLNHLPIDITYVDKDDVVRYFSAGKERIFIRTEAVIGRNVQNCHPPDSMDRVNRILDDFKAGRRDSADFWLNYGGRFVHIRYFAVRGHAGEYVGTLEVTQDVTAIRALNGERRLLDE